MDFFVELIVEILFEGAIAILFNKKINIIIRIIIFIPLLVFYLAIILLLLYAGLREYTKNRVIGISLILLAIGLLILSVYGIKKTKLKKKK